MSVPNQLKNLRRSTMNNPKCKLCQQWQKTGEYKFCIEHKIREENKKNSFWTKLKSWFKPQPVKKSNQPPQLTFEQRLKRCEQIIEELTKEENHE